MTRKLYTQEEIQALLNELMAGPQGTPGSLGQALEHLSLHLYGTAWNASQQRVARMRLRDYMASVFTLAMAKHPESELVLKALFEELFK